MVLVNALYGLGQVLTSLVVLWILSLPSGAKGFPGANQVVRTTPKKDRENTVEKKFFGVGKCNVSCFQNLRISVYHKVPPSLPPSLGSLPPCLPSPLLSSSLTYVLPTYVDSVITIGSPCCWMNWLRTWKCWRQQIKYARAQKNWKCLCQSARQLCSFWVHFTCTFSPLERLRSTLTVLDVSMLLLMLCIRKALTDTIGQSGGSNSNTCTSDEGTMMSFHCK